jgi:hypothetical protein
MKIPRKEIVEQLRSEYPEGTRVELVRMDDPQAPPVGTKGTVQGVDDAGSILVAWDNGSSLNVAYGPDQVRVLVGEFTETVKEQILAIRATGETNMFDVPMVQQIANREGYYELVIFLIDHTKEYVHFIMTGKTE